MNIQYCEVCSEKKAKYVCHLCNRRICEDHAILNDNVIICSICSSLLCELCRRRLSIHTCPICDRLMCTVCSVQLTPVHRVCKECFQKLGKREVLRRLMLL